MSKWSKLKTLNKIKGKEKEDDEDDDEKVIACDSNLFT